LKETYNQLKDVKNSTQAQIDKTIRDNSYKSVVNELKNDGIALSDLTTEEFEQLLAEEIQKQKSFSKGAAVGAGALFLLGLLG